ncbi:MAG: ComEA family DNA-binding protein [Pseudomonadota bacterium]
MTIHYFREVITQEAGMHKVKRLFVSVLVSMALLVPLQVNAGPVDINTADAATLASAINGVGEKKAATIVAYREMHGPFTHVEDLSNVKGIGPGTVEKNRQNLQVGSMGE